MKRCSFLTVNSLILGVFGASLCLAHSKDPLVIGPVRADGLIVPVAMWQHGAWVELTPEYPDPLQWVLPDEWYFVGENGERRVINRSNAVKIIRSDMGHDSWGTMTDFSLPPEVSDRRLGSTIRTVGFASSRAITVFPFLKPGRRDVLWDEVTALIKAKLDSAATEELPGLETNTWFRLGVCDTMTLRCSIASLPGGDLFVGHAFATLELGDNSQDPGCTENVSFSGWLVGDRGSVAPARWRVWQDDCDFMRADGDEPIAVFEHHGRLFILYTELGYEWYERKLLEYVGGKLTNVNIHAR